MSEHDSWRHGLRSGGGTNRLLLVALASVLTASACIGDVVIPPCVQDDSCRADGGGAGAEDSVGGESAAGPEGGAGTSAGGTHAPNSGNAGSPSEATPGGAGSVGAAAGEGGGGEAEAAECTSCSILPLDLVPPCAGAPYSTTLSVQGGVAPFSWQLTSSSDAWSITGEPGHPTNAILTSESAPPGDTTLTVRVLDATGKQKKVAYSFHPRNACWFAYTALGSSGPQLHLLDPLAELPAPVALQNNSGVYDFRFSPDGAFLAYRFGADVDHPRGQHVALVDLRTLKERVLSFGEDFVTGFAWSPDSSTVAASFKIGSTTYLGAVRVPAPRSGAGPTSLTSTVAYVESDLSWVGNRFVAFHAELLRDKSHPGEFRADNPAKLRTPFYAELQETGFAAQVTVEGTFSAGVWLKPTELGFYMVAPDQYSAFMPLVGDSHLMAVHSQIRLIGPSGRYSALVDADNLLQIVSAEGGSNSARAAHAQIGDTCPKLLAWAGGVERLACVADIPNAGGATTHGEVRIFDLKAGNDLLTMATVGGFCVDDVTQINAASCGQLQKGYAFGSTQATGAARAFSASGRWFAFSRAVQQDNYLYWADLGATPFALAGTLYFAAGGAPTRLVFSPNERFLMFQQGAQLSLQELTTGNTTTLSLKLPLSSACTEDFPMAPDAYCGNTDRVAELQWSADSLALAFRVKGALTVADLTQFPDAVHFPLVAPECGQACSGQFSFQPPIAD